MTRKKPADKTCLYGKRFVSKQHGRIAFRGMIDSLEAEFLEARILASSLGCDYIRACFDEAAAYLQKIMAAEVKNEAFRPSGFFGLSAEEIHRQSQVVKEAFGLAEHPLPEPGMGPLAARINLLRTRVREGELLAVRVFGGFFGRRMDLISAMNLLSSALWWLFCKHVSSIEPAGARQPVTGQPHLLSK